MVTIRRLRTRAATSALATGSVLKATHIRIFLRRMRLLDMAYGLSDIDDLDGLLANIARLATTCGWLVGRERHGRRGRSW
jgi:hypothetical protein